MESTRQITSQDEAIEIDGENFRIGTESIPQVEQKEKVSSRELIERLEDAIEKEDLVFPELREQQRC